MAEVTTKNVYVYKKNIEYLHEIVEIVNNIVPLELKKTILLTAEEFIDTIANAIMLDELKNSTSFTGSPLGNDIIFDRMQFYQFVENLRCVATPKTVDTDVDPNAYFGDKYVVRLKRTWLGEKKLPRLKIVHSKDEKEKLVNDFMRMGLTPDMWCYQELLSISDSHNVSVCGWHDKTFRQYCVTRKLLQHPPKVGNGDVVEIYKDAPDYLQYATETILCAMDYEGPFEMEFVYDMNSEEYKVIELNPRFWMQHGIVNQVAHMNLIRRAIGERDLTMVPLCDQQHKYWINGNQFIYRLLKGQLSIVKYAYNGDFYPSLSNSLKWLFYYRKYKKELV